MLTPPSCGVRRLRGGAVGREVRRRAHNHCSFHAAGNECLGPSGMRWDREKNPLVPIVNYDRFNGRKSSGFRKNEPPGENPRCGGWRSVRIAVGARIVIISLKSSKSPLAVRRDNEGRGVSGLLTRPTPVGNRCHTGGPEPAARCCLCS